MQDPEYDAFEHAIAILGEHFERFSVVVQFEEGDIMQQGCGDNLIMEGLHRNAVDIIKAESDIDIDAELIWDDDDDEDWGASS